MAGPMSLPEGPRSRWEEMNEIVCDVHFHCDMRVIDKDGNAVKHDFITYRLWLLKRNRLHTGKTV